MRDFLNECIDEEFLVSIDREFQTKGAENVKDLSENLDGGISFLSRIAFADLSWRFGGKYRFSQCLWQFLSPYMAHTKS